MMWCDMIYMIWYKVGEVSCNAKYIFKFDVSMMFFVLTYSWHWCLWWYLRLVHRQKWRTFVVIATVLQAELYRFRSQLKWYKLHQITLKLVNDHIISNTVGQVKASLDTFGISLLQLNLYPLDGWAMSSIVLHKGNMFVKLRCIIYGEGHSL